MQKIDSSFRPLNENEQKVICAAWSRREIRSQDLRLTRIEDLRVSYEILPSCFTICIVKLAESKFPMWTGDLNSDRYTTAEKPVLILWRGASCKSKDDRRNPIRGQVEAFKRMLKSKPVVYRVD